MWDNEAIIDGFVKKPISALRFIPRHCGVPSVRLIPRDSQALISAFLRTRQYFRVSPVIGQQRGYSRHVGLFSAARNMFCHPKHPRH
jgi:hypothetical protein